MKEVNPDDETQLLRELDDLMTKQWPCNFVECYIPQHLEVPRHPLRDFIYSEIRFGSQPDLRVNKIPHSGISNQMQMASV